MPSLAPDLWLRKARGLRFDYPRSASNSDSLYSLTDVGTGGKNGILVIKQFHQCLLRRGTQEMTAWIESRGAEVGVDVELLPSGEWWTVAEVYSLGVPEDVLKETKRLNRKSLPSIEAMR